MPEDTGTVYRDGDADGYDESADCDDLDGSVHPGATEVVADGLDQDCDGVDSCYTDADGDNYGTAVVASGSSLDCDTGEGAAVATDCDDADGSTNPAATDACGDGVDQDCDGSDSTECSLSSADAQYTGEADDDHAGISVSTAGDFDADGYDDLLIGAYKNDDGGSWSGAAYLILGSASPESLGLTSANAQYTGQTDFDWAGWSVSGAGDVNADGYDDLLVGAWDNDDGGSDAGAAYLVLGSASPTSLGLASADAQYTGEAIDDYAGWSVSAAGDVDADGFDDLFIGAVYNDDGGNRAGAAYLVLGSASPTSLGLVSADAQYTGVSDDDHAGESVSGAGDVDADGYDDLLVGAQYAEGGGNDKGAAWLILGSASPTSLGLASANAQYTGEDYGDYAGESVSAAGDIDADGYDDLLIGARGNDDGGNSPGAAYLILGSVAPASMRLGSANAKYTGEADYNGVGVPVSAAGDVDADGYDDLLIGAVYNEDGGSGAGAAYLVLGSAFPASLGLASADAQYTGEADGDYAGRSVSAAGDVDADGYDDLLIGAYENDNGGSDAGAAYLILGK